MKIETTLDKVVISTQELNEIVRAHIEKETGRKLHSIVQFSVSNIQNLSCWAHLKDKE